VIEEETWCLHCEDEEVEREGDICDYCLRQYECCSNCGKLYQKEDLYPCTTTSDYHCESCAEECKEEEE